VIPRGFVFLGQSSRAFARSPSPTPLFATALRDHERRRRPPFLARERSLAGSPGREQVRAFNGSGPGSGGVQQLDLVLGHQ
jgi:hypothetical protein